MEYRQLGDSDLHISRISLGCMSLPPDESLATTIIAEARSAGINYFDTADIYNDGANEVLIGKALKSQRSSVIIASKAGNVRRPDGGLDWNPRKQHILDSLDNSLRRLQTDYIDLYQLHGGTTNDNIDEVIEAFELLKSNGKIRYYGISSIRPNVISEYLKKSAIVSDMIQYSLLDRRPEEQCLEWLLKKNVGVLARGSVAQGLLVDKPAKPYLDHSREQVEAAAAAVRSLATGNRTATNVALRYVLQNDAVTSAVVGIRTQQQLQAAATLFDSAPLSEEEIDLLRRSIPASFYKEHRVDQ